MVLELNEVLLDGEPHTLSFIAHEGRLTCLTGGQPQRMTRWLLAMMGFELPKNGYISIDGEPLCEGTIGAFRRLMAYAPAKLKAVGEIRRYAPPSVQDVFTLHANRDLPISNGILGEEIRRICADSTDDSVRLLAVAVLRNKPILLIENAKEQTADYLVRQARQGRIVIATTSDERVLAVADEVVGLL